MSNTASSFIGDLKKITDGLMFQSESDYPVEPFEMKLKEGSSLSATEIIQAEHLSVESPVKEMSIDEFFGSAMQEQEWQDENGRARAKRFKALVELCKANLSQIKVYKIGEVEADVYVVGRAGSGDIAGVKTKVVET